MKHVSLSFLTTTIFIFILTQFPSFASEPTELMKITVDKIISILNDEELKKSENTEARRAAIRNAVFERFDFEEMSRRSLARQWKQITPEERKEFTALFSDLLERSYIGKIEGYSGEKIVFTEEDIDGHYSTVKTVAITKRDVKIPINYRLMKSNNTWKVYDVIIEGVSLINNYRRQFNKIIRTQSYKELVKRMQDKQEEEMEFEKIKQGKPE